MYQMEKYIQILKEIEDLEFSEENLVEVIYLLDSALKLSKSDKDLNDNLKLSNNFETSRNYISNLFAKTKHKSFAEIEMIFKEIMASLNLDIELHFCSVNYEGFQTLKKKMGLKNYNEIDSTPKDL